ncbi:MAG TPA: tripartite tricarboxylate transporter substrate-binding protein [Candidatus Binatia bacterium]|jgi:tripartite-type tricarboxylate transporter receptor subunit TctC|nr:tripartite tricarboxylate transporter substrate-binding protein [Candidatus Binatia bacterium]
MKIGSLLLSLCLAVSFTATSLAQEFYKGKTIRVIVGGTAGGGFDVYTRAMTRHMGKHIPGNPTFVVDNMTGAATRIAAKYMHSSAKPDGLTFGIFNGYLILGRVLGTEGIDFDVRQFEYLGVPVKDNVVCALHKASGVTNFQQWVAAKTPVKIGGLGPGNSTSDVPRILKAALDLPLQLVEGYKGTADVRLAADAGEVGGGCWAWESVKVTWASGLQSGSVNVVVQATPKALPELSKVPVALEVAKTEEGRQLIKAGAVDVSSITRVYATTPGTPKDRVQTLRKAFIDTLKDPEFVAEAKKSNLEIDPLTGEEVQKTVAGLFNLNPATVSKLASVLAVK